MTHCDTQGNDGKNLKFYYINSIIFISSRHARSPRHSLKQCLYIFLWERLRDAFMTKNCGATWANWKLKLQIAKLSIIRWKNFRPWTNCFWKFLIFLSIIKPVLWFKNSKNVISKRYFFDPSNIVSDSSKIFDKIHGLS